MLQSNAMAGFSPFGELMGNVIIVIFNATCHEISPISDYGMRQTSELPVGINGCFEALKRQGSISTIGHIIFSSPNEFQGQGSDFFGQYCTFDYKVRHTSSAKSATEILQMNVDVFGRNAKHTGNT